MLSLLAEIFPDGLPAPCPNAGRLWILHLGMYALTSPKEKADDWVWIMDHTLQLGQWKCLVIVGIRLEHCNAQAELRLRLEPLASGQAGQRMRAALLKFVGEQSRQADEQERLIGSSEVIESLIGKYKRIQSTHSKGGMTATLLSFGAIVVDKTADTIHRALDSIKTKDVCDWVKRKLGITIQAQRTLAFEGTKPALETVQIAQLV